MLQINEKWAVGSGQSARAHYDFLAVSKTIKYLNL